MPDVSGTTEKYVDLDKFEYYADIDNNYDFATTRAQRVYVILRGGTYVANVEEKGEGYAVLKIEYPDGREASLIKFALGQTIGVVLGEDGAFDLFFTLTDILTRRAVFHIEKNTDARITSAVTKEVKKEEKPSLVFNLDKKMNLTAIKIAAVILISLMIIYVFLRVVRGRITNTRRKR